MEGLGLGYFSSPFPGLDDMSEYFNECFEKVMNYMDEMKMAAVREVDADTTVPVANPTGDID
jgi:hypothetical protein